MYCFFVFFAGMMVGYFFQYQIFQFKKKVAKKIAAFLKDDE